MFFQTLNSVVEPIVRAGVGSPGLFLGGFIVLEVQGRKTGRVFRSPLMATRIGAHVLVSTFRGERSQWIRNLAARPQARYWLRGKRHDAKAFVVRNDRPIRVPKYLPEAVRSAIRLRACLLDHGWGFAVLSPRSP